MQSHIAKISADTSSPSMRTSGQALAEVLIDWSGHLAAQYVGPNRVELTFDPADQAQLERAFQILGFHLEITNPVIDSTNTE